MPSAHTQPPSFVSISPTHQEQTHSHDFNPDLTHERALLGAVDSYLGELVHVRPFLAQHYREICESMAEEWLESGGRNAIDALTPEWLSQYVVRQTDSAAAAEVLSSFCGWAVDQGLIVDSPF